MGGKYRLDVQKRKKENKNMSQSGRYAVVYWKGLRKNDIKVCQFEDEQDTTAFAEEKRESGFGVMVGEWVSVDKEGIKTYRMKNYGAYPYFKVFYKLIGLILIGIIIFLILSWK
jgi:hypothetical protein